MRLSDYMDSRSISAKELAAMLDISVASLNNYISGRRMTPLDVAMQIKSITKGRVTMEDLLEEYRSKAYVRGRLVVSGEDD